MNTIHWSLSDFSETYPFGSRSDWEDRLGNEEKAELERLRVPKRRAEWLAARLAVKELYRKSSDPATAIPDNCIQIKKEESGVPYLSLDGLGRATGWLSLSHSEGKVFCALSHNEGVRFGVDLEKVVPRSPEFVHDFFTETEIQQVGKLSGHDRDALVNLIWSTKEAVLKAIGLGLQRDTRQVEVLTKRYSGRMDGWSSLEVLIYFDEINKWKVFWREESGYMLTLCISDAPGVDIVRCD
jgi:phosphopantetheinyl transferase